jgi:hypothetical protein
VLLASTPARFGGPEPAQRAFARRINLQADVCEAGVFVKLHCAIVQGFALVEFGRRAPLPKQDGGADKQQKPNVMDASLRHPVP